MVYCLHLLFFETLMASPYQGSSAPTTLSSHKSSDQGKHLPIESEYRLLLKHEDAKQSFCDASNLTEPVETTAVPVFRPCFIHVTYHPVSFTLSDDAFKRYRLLKVFLI
jgi:hypothetical protein